MISRFSNLAISPSVARVLARIGAFILLITGLLKATDFIMGYPHEARNVVFPFITDQVVLDCAMLVEFVVAIYVLKVVRNKITNAMLALAWISTLFVFYRIALAWTAPHHSCLCGGAGLLFLWLQPLPVKWIMTILLCYLLGVSYGWLLKNFLFQFSPIFERFCNHPNKS